jgi:hypothetical protein
VVGTDKTGQAPTTHETVVGTDLTGQAPTVHETVVGTDLTGQAPTTHETTGEIAGAGVGQLANTGGAPLTAQALFGALLAALGAALMRPRDLFKKFGR